MNRTFARLGAVSAALVLALVGASTAHAATAAYTDPDRGICQDGTVSTPPGIYVREANQTNDPLVFLTKTGYNGSQDHFYIESDYVRSNGAHWYRGYGYDVDNGTKTYGEVLDSWIARSGGGC